jgi:hypothetical protein
MSEEDAMENLKAKTADAFNNFDDLKTPARLP